MTNLQKLHESLAYLAQSDQHLRSMPLPAAVRRAMDENLKKADEALRALGADISAHIVAERRKKGA